MVLYKAWACLGSIWDVLRKEKERYTKITRYRKK